MAKTVVFNTSKQGTIWRVSPPTQRAGHGDTVQVVVAGAPHSFDLNVPSGLGSDKTIQGATGRFTIVNSAASGQTYFFDVVVDGTNAQANSSPAVIIE